MQRRLLRGGCGIIRVRFISPFTPRDRLDISITPTIDFHIRRRMCMQMQTPHLYSPLHSIPLDFLVLQIRTVRHTLPLSSQVLALPSPSALASGNIPYAERTVWS